MKEFIAHTLVEGHLRSQSNKVFLVAMALVRKCKKALEIFAYLKTTLYSVNAHSHYSTIHQVGHGYLRSISQGNRTVKVLIHGHKLLHQMGES